MKYILSLFLIGWVIGCSKEEAEPVPWNLAASFVTSDGNSLFDRPDYDIDLIDFSPGVYSSIIFRGCEDLIKLPGVDNHEFYIDFNNGDIDTINYKWDDGKSSSFPDVGKLNWLEVYYNNNLVKKWEFSNQNERIDFQRRHCPVETCPTDCSLPDVIEIIKD